jgi:hypothetical protein
MKKERINMQFIHDAWVNLVSEDNHYGVPDFHEWRKEENIELVDQTPVFKVDKNTFDYIAFGRSELVEFANKVKGKTFFRKNHERVETDYCFVACDGERVLFVRLNEDKTVTLKSKLIPRQFQLVIEMVQDSKEVSHPIDKLIELSEYKKYVGLTRSEKESYKVLESFLEDISENDLAMVKYLLSEISYSTYETVRNGSFKECLEALNNVPMSVIVKESDNIEKVLEKLAAVK